MKSFDVVLLVPLSEEFDSVKEVFEVTRTFVHDKITYYELTPREEQSDFPDIDIVATVLNEMGNTNAAQKTERVLKSIDPPSPELVALVGIAGRLDDDLRLGDVVVADQVTNYEVRSKIADAEQTQSAVDSADLPEESSGTAATTASETTTGTTGDDNNDGTDDNDEPNEYEPPWTLIDWRPGGHTRRPAIELTEAVSEFRNSGTHYHEWQEAAQSQFNDWINAQLSDEEQDEKLTEVYYDPPPQVHKRHVASGGLIVTSTEFSKQLESHNRNMAAVEMEAAGVLLAVKRTDGVNSIILRGISDYADKEKSNLDSMGGGLWRRCATYAAASCLSQFLEGGYLETVIAESPTGPTEKSTLDRGGTGSTAQSRNLDDLTVDISGGGPETNFGRRHRIADDRYYTSDSPPNGLSLALAFDIQVSAPVNLQNIDITTDQLDRPEVVEQEIMVSGTIHDTTDGTYTHLSDPPTLDNEEAVPIRLAKRYRLDDPESVDIAATNSIPITLSLELEHNGTSAAFEYRGRIDQTDGLVGISKLS